jgi:hypothetical protein
VDNIREIGEIHALPGWHVGVEDKAVQCVIEANTIWKCFCLVGETKGHFISLQNKFSRFPASFEQRRRSTIRFYANEGFGTTIEPLTKNNIAGFETENSKPPDPGT